MLLKIRKVGIAGKQVIADVFRSQTATKNVRLMHLEAKIPQNWYK